jgi:hypothetical protein
MKRIVTLGAIVTAFAVAPSVAAAENRPSHVQPQLTAHVVGVQISQVQRARAAVSVQRARAAAVSVQRHRVLISRAQGFSVLLRTQR